MNKNNSTYTLYGVNKTYEQRTQRDGRHTRRCVIQETKCPNPLQIEGVGRLKESCNPGNTTRGAERATLDMQGMQGTACLVTSMSGAARVLAANIVATTAEMILKDICEEEGVVTYLKNSPMTILTHLEYFLVGGSFTLVLLR